MKWVHKPMQSKGHNHLKSGMPTSPEKRLPISRSSDSDTEEKSAQS